MGVFNSVRLLGFGLGPIAAGSVVQSGPYPFGGVSRTDFATSFVFGTALAALGLLLVYTQVVETVGTESTKRDEAVPQD